MSERKLPRVFVHVVTFNHSETIIPCLESVLSQQGFNLSKNLKVTLTDNNSNDRSAEIVADHFGKKISVETNAINQGFATAHNKGITKGLEWGANYILVLNPDVRLESDALKKLVLALENDPRAGVSCPKLLRSDSSLNPVSPQTFDTSGMFITPEIRHFDRGSEETDTGQFDREEYVFGASGAAMLLRDTFIKDVSLQKNDYYNLFDDAFFAYREDADLAWRALWLGWKCRYIPQAVGNHKRVVTPERRKKLPSELNAYSVRNRFLLQLNNFSLLANYRGLFRSLWRNLLVIGASCTIERKSLPALRSVIQLAPRALANRHSIIKRSRVSPLEVGQWFKKKPYSEPALVAKKSAEPIRSVSIVVINYNSGERLGVCLRNLLQGISEARKTANIRVRVMDNASSDGSASRIEPLFRGVNDFEFYFSHRNLGFAGAINKAAEKEDSDAMLILNPDVQVSGSSIVEMINALDNYEDLGAVAPVLYGNDGYVQLGFTVRGFPSIGSTLMELFYFHRLLPKNPWTQAHNLRNNRFVYEYLTQATPGSEVPHENPDLPLVVDQPAGACLLIRRSAFDDVGGFNADFWPAWFEDVDFCKRLADKKYLCAVLGSAFAVHEGGYSLETLPAGRFTEIWYPNLVKFWKIHGSKQEYISLRILLPFALLLRGAVSLFSGGKDSKTRLIQSKTLFRLALGPKQR